MSDTSLVFRILARGGAQAEATFKRVASAVDDVTDKQAKFSRVASGLGKAGRVTGLLTLAAGAVQLTHALIPAAGAALALPGALATAQGAMLTAKLGMVGLGDAMSAVAEGDAAKLDESLKKLSPRARAFVKEAASMRSQVVGLQRAVQNRLFAGLDGDLDRLGKNLLPTARTGMVQVAGSLNMIGREAAATASTPWFRGQVARIMGSTASTVQVLSGAVGPLITLVTRLAVAGLPFTRQLAIWATDGIKSAAAFVATAQSSGRLAAVIDRAQTTLAQLGRIARNLGSGLLGVFRGSNVASADLLDTIERLTGKFAAWANSAKGQKQISEVFRTLAEVGGQVVHILPLIAGPLGAVFHLINGLPPGLKDLATQGLAFAVVVGAIGPKLIPLISGLRMVGQTVIWMTRLFMANPWMLLVAALVVVAVLIVTHWDTIKKATAAAWSWIVSKIKAAGHAIMAGVSVLASLPGKVAGWFGSLKNAAVSRAQALVSWMKGLPGRIRSAVGSLGGLLVSAGRSVVTGLWNGIVGMGSWLYGKIMGWVRSVVPGPILRFLGIASPSKLAAKWGMAVAQGMAGGMLSGSRLVSSASGALAGAVARPPVGAPAGAPLGSAAAAGRRDVLEIRGDGSALGDLLVEVLRKAIQNKGGKITVLFPKGATA